MAYERNPNDPYQPNPANEDLQRAPMDREFQADPELAEGPASSSRIAIYAIAAAVILGAVFYGLNNSSMNSTTEPTSTASTTTPSSTANPKAAPNNNVAEQTKPPVAPGVRDVTPYNTQPGTTTGAAPAHPQQQPAPGASQQMTPPAPANNSNTTK
jgi:hypothetical protein